MVYAVECQSLFKKYKTTQALVNVSLNIEKDKIYGLLGRNGAGKSTLLNIISSQIFPDKGEIKIFGSAPYENEKALQNICTVKDTNMFLKELKVGEALDIASGFYPYWDREMAEKLLKEFGLDKRKTYKNLSLGMKSQLAITLGLASRAPITIFDEPHIGLDAASRQLFYDVLIEDYMINPRTIILSTHLIDEVSNLLEDVIILHEGSVKMEGNLEDIKNKAFYITGIKENIEKYVSEKNSINREEFGNTVKVLIFDYLSEEERKAMEADNLSIKPVSLQELFIFLTGGKLRKRGDINE